jgi:hypothetical protein
MSIANRFISVLVRALPIPFLIVAGTPEALALPSFARQTGEACESCHVGAYGPQLTPHGMKFKMGGYVDSDGKGGHVPLSAMLLGTTTSLKTDMPEGDVTEHFSSNDNAVLQEASVFLAGKMSDHLGAFAQATYSDVSRKVELDNVDVRYASETTLLGQEGTFGVSLNNNPGFQDAFNTLPGFRFPYASPDLTLSPSAAPLLDGMLGGTVYGISAYTYLNNGVYAELGGYRTLSNSFLKHVNLAADQEVSGVAPYWRLAYFKDMHSQAFSAGLFGMSADLRAYGVGGPSDKYTDVGVDGHYQYLGNRKHIFSVNGAYIHETRKQDALFEAGEVENADSHLDQFNIAGSYYYDKSYGVTARYFTTSGSSDSIVYASNSTTKPDSDGWTLQADWSPFGKEGSWQAPWANLRVGLQYTMYNKFEGARTNYDGTGRNASDNNTTMGFVWTSF